MTGDVEIRQAELADYDDVVAFASDTWAERRGDGDYIPQVFEDWVASDGPRQRTLVADTGDDIAAIAQFVLLSEHEAWAQGMRTNPDYRGRGVGSTLVHEGFDWARSLSEDVEILTRVTDTEKASAAFRAGADYVLSVQRVSARLVAAEVHGERVMDPVGQIRLVRADAAPFVGQTVATASDPEKGWTVVGVVHDGEVNTNQAAAIDAGDEVFVAGSDSTIRGFEQSVD